MDSFNQNFENSNNRRGSERTGGRRGGRRGLRGRIGNESRGRSLNRRGTDDINQSFSERGSNDRRGIGGSRGNNGKGGRGSNDRRGIGGSRGNNGRGGRGSNDRRGIGGSRGNNGRGGRGSNDRKGIGGSRGNNGRGGRSGHRGRGGTIRGGHNSSSGGSRPIGIGLLKAWNELNDNEELLIRLIASKKLLIQLLNSQELEDEKNLELLTIFSKVCEIERSQNKIAILALLHDCKYINLCLKKSLVVWGSTKTMTNKMKIATSLVTLINVYFRSFPSRYMDMPLDALDLFVSENLEKESDLVAQVNALTLARKEALKKTQIPFQRRLQVEFTNEAPPDDFRDIPVVPDVNDIRREEKPYLRPLKSHGKYSDGEEYLDVQFRLLREDLVCPLREGVQEIINDVPQRDRKHVLHIYKNVEVLSPFCTNRGMVHLVHFDPKYTKHVCWKNSKRLLSKNLVCLSKDKFETMIFAIVADRDPDDLTEGFVCLRFMDGLEAKDYFENEEIIEMVESPAYFEAYRHVLNTMKEFDADDVPMKRYIVDGDSDVKTPAYLRRRDVLDPKYNLRSSLGIKRLVSILDDHAWPKHYHTDLNKSQFNAFKHALTKEFAVIQGPPGTGKTHVGVRIADALLQNEEARNIDQKAPILVVCFTNHALDQFLGGIIKFGHPDVIRAGGRASEEMKKYSLRETAHNCKFLLEAKHKSNKERNDLMEILNDLSGEVEKCRARLRSGSLVHFDKLQGFMKEEHQSFFNNLDKHCRSLKISIFDIFLDLLKIPIENIKAFKLEYIADDVKTGESNYEEGKFAEAEVEVEVEGEGQALVKQWAVNPSEYKVTNMEHKKKRKVQDISKKYIVVDSDGFKVVQPPLQERKRRINDLLRNYDPMSAEEAHNVDNPWKLSIKNKCRLYKYWLHRLYDQIDDIYRNKAEVFEDLCEQVNELRKKEDEIKMKNASIIAMTTSYAANNQKILQKIQPKVVIIEEAAEVLEGHVLTSLTSGVEHLILIGDHQQLKPNPAVYELATRYSLEVSLFERTVNNGMECHTLNVQHRMRPQISLLLRHIYPKLKNHSSVERYPNIKGVGQNVMFINHHKKEDHAEDMKSKANKHEAEFIKGLCLYLLKQGYQRDQITILTSYGGQLFQMKSIMPKKDFEGIRITTVDNFQGEENDIILLSLVRSNDQGSIGFLKTSNRICVALSRAKQGLFIIGNFDLLTENSKLWKKIVADANINKSFGTSMKLYCQNHVNTIINAENAVDFLKAPDGGCMRPCGFRLDCGHVCEKSCHPIDREHVEYICDKFCLKETCQEHKCQKRCHHNEECGPCIAEVERIVPKCGHLQQMLCKDDPNEFGCLAQCEKVLKCGHPCNLYCKDKCETQECHAKVLKALPCEHSQNVYCSSDVSTIICEKLCLKKTCQEHECQKRCHHNKECGPCIAAVKRIVPKCKHLQEMECKDEPAEFGCLEHCEKVLECGHRCNLYCKDKCETQECHAKVLKVLPCKHSQNANCCSEVSTIKCRTSCTTKLDCGHTCDGACGECRQGRLHKKCLQKCEKILVCSHQCKKSCASKCLPCVLQCQNKCVHGKCKKKCGDVCSPCEEPCTWNCKHEACPNLCSETCNRKPCNRPCEKKLKCDHPCIGLCGEVCPPACRVCQKDKVEENFFGGENENSARFVVLEDCQHFFEVKGLDKWMEQDNRDDGKVKMKECPRCKTIIRKSLRYGNIVKNTLKDVNQIKKIIENESSDLDVVKEKAYQKCRDINNFIETVTRQHPPELNVAISSALKRDNNINTYLRNLKRNVDDNSKSSASELATQLANCFPGIGNVNALFHQVTLLEMLWEMRREVLENENLQKDKHTILEGMVDLEGFVITKRISGQQLRDATEELERKYAYISVIASATELNTLEKRIEMYKGTKKGLDTKQQMMASSGEKLQRMKVELEKKEKLSKSRIEEIKCHVEEINKKFRKKGIAKHRILPVTASVFGKGRWYKCSNNHFYAIDQREEAIKAAKCPECSKIIGARNHALLSRHKGASHFRMRRPRMRTLTRKGITERTRSEK